MKPSGSFVPFSAAARALGVTHYRVLWLVATRQVRARRAGARLLVRVADVARALDAAAR